MPGSVPLFDTPAARALDVRATERLGGDAYVLMQRAGQAAWRHVLQHWPQAHGMVVVCGPGNNGGDGYVLATLARRSGRKVQVLHLPQHGPRTGLAQRACTTYVAEGGPVEIFEGRLPAAALVVDALFGIGLERAPDAAAAQLIEAINAQSAPVFALDAPSGVDAGRGHVPGIAVTAQRTLQFIVGHAGLRTGAALEQVGTLALDDLGVPREAFDGVEAGAELLSADMLARWLPPRRRNTHKGESGRLLCIGGEHGSGGAILLCAEAALRSGAGLLRVATRASHVIPLLTRCPEAMARGVESGEALPPLLEQADVVALGPGLGQGEWGHAMFALSLQAQRSLVMDADALNLLAAYPVAVEDAILTPHPGEAARLLGMRISEIQADRYAAARAMADRFASVVVLKGAGTVIAAPGRTPRVIDAGNPGMATGGMGDVLTGVIAALRGQGLETFDAACAGALLHSLAADMASEAGERGLLPSDLMPYLRQLANP